MYKPLQKKSSSWASASIQKKSKNFSKPGRSTIQQKPNSQEIPNYSTTAADLLAANVMRSLENKEQDEPMQMSTPVQRAFQGGGTQASGDLESRLNVSQGGGNALAPEVRAFMEPRFGADFSAVRVHTGGEAVQMNRELGAQAFTHGSNIYFGEGKSPGSNELTAHELTHVVQQTGGIQRQENSFEKELQEQPVAQAGEPEPVLAAGLSIQRDPPDSLPQVPSYQLTPPSLLQPPDPASRYGFGQDFQLHLDPQIQAMAMQQVQQQINPATLLPALSQINLAQLTGLAPIATSAPNPFAAPTLPPASPLVPRGAGPSQPRAAGVGDLMEAILAVPAIETAITNLKTQVTEQLRRDWGRLNTGERAGVVSTLAVIGGGALAGVLSDPNTQQLALSQLNGRVLPVPGLDWLHLEMNTGGDNLMVGMHVDVGRLLPPSLGFGSSDATPIGNPPISSSEGTIQRLCDECEAELSDKEEKPTVQQHRVFSQQSNPSPVTVSLSKTDLIQRDVNDLITTPVVLDGSRILTYEELAAWYGWRRLSLMEQRDELNREGLAVPDSVTQAITRAQELIDLNIGGSTEPITEGIVSDARAWLRTYTGAMNAAEAEKGAEAARRLRNAQERASAAQNNLEKTVIPQLRERQRSSFRSEDNSELLQVADTIGTALDTLMNLKEVMLEIRREAAVLENMRNFAAGHTGLIPSANSRAPIVIGILDRINQLYAGFQLLRAGIDLVAGRHRTESAAARSGVSAMATTYSAGGTLLGASAGVSMYANFYIGPMTSACLDALGRLEDILSRTQNRTLIELGEYDSVNWSIEPGGRPMFNFMRRVMQAGSSGDIPTPIPAAVESYLMDHRDSFNAGIGSHRGAMPTTGWIFKDLAQSQATSWVFIHRDNLWGMLYGAATPPR